MEIRVLRYFLTVAREENITRAANVLHITQPTLSRQLMQLEEELDAQLFIRGKHRLTLTDDGMLLKRRAEEIVTLTDKMEKEFLNKDNMIHGEIFIGGGETRAMHSVSKVMKQFQELYPHVQFHIYSGNADDVKEKLDKGLLDFGLLVEPVNIEKYDFIRLKEKDRWGALVLKEGPLGQKEYLTPEDLMNASLIVSRRMIVRNEIASWAGIDFDKLKCVATFNLVNNAAVMVEEGLGIALTIDKIIHLHNDSKIRFIPFYPELNVGNVIVWKKHQTFSQASQKFLNMLKKVR